MNTTGVTVAVAARTTSDISDGPALVSNDGGSRSDVVVASAGREVMKSCFFYSDELYSTVDLSLSNSAGQQFFTWIQADLNIVLLQDTICNVLKR